MIYIGPNLYIGSFRVVYISKNDLSIKILNCEDRIRELDIFTRQQKKALNFNVCEAFQWQSVSSNT